MALIVQKYGGTSVGSTERIKNVARRVANFKAKGHQVVVVLSAMSGETNRLIGLAREIQQNPDPRELDVIISTGEQVTIGLLAMALKELGVNAATQFSRIETKVDMDQASFSCQRNIFAFQHALIGGSSGIILANDFVANMLFADQFEDGLKEVDI